MGKFEVLTDIDGAPIGTVSLARRNEWTSHPADVRIPDGVRTLYLRYRGVGYADLLDFTLERK